MTEILAVWTLPAIAAAIVGGLLLGLVVVARFDNPRFDAIETIGVMVILGMGAGLSFWVGQAVATAAEEGERLAWRVVSRFAIWGVFVIAMAVGTGIGVRFQRGTWR